MKVENVKIYDLEESLIASGYPMRTDTEYKKLEDKDVNRGKKLVDATKTGNGAHAQFLTGIRVNFDLTCSNKMWVEAERYRFLEFVSSQSTMHRITKFDLNKAYNKYVDPRVVEIMKEKVNKYNDYCFKIATSLTPQSQDILQQIENNKKKMYLEILYTNPSGFELTARMTTNYRCLRNIYLQRKDHRLPEWREFCKWIETLPYAKELLVSE